MLSVMGPSQEQIWEGHMIFTTPLMAFMNQITSFMLNATH